MAEQPLSAAPKADSRQSNMASVDQEVVLPVVEEQAHIRTRRLETGQVVVHVTPRVQNESIRLELAEEQVDVERVEVNQFVQGPVEIRQEGDVTIVPVVEEVLVVEKRLMLREEVRLTRRRRTRPHVEHVSLRTEQVEIRREKTASG